MKSPGMKKYYVGLVVIGVLVFGLTIYALVASQASKKDLQTDKKAQDIVTKLNAYIDRQATVPDSLAAAGIKDVPDSIHYTKKASDTYEFCVKYNSASSYTDTDVTGLLWGSYLRGSSGSSLDTSADSLTPASYLYLPYYHKKGENCQTVKPYVSSYTPTSIFTPTTTTPAIDYNSNSSLFSSSSNAQDTERQADILSLFGQVEAYYAQNGRYPTLANLNDASWRATNMQGLDKEALRDPQETGYTIVGAPAVHSYAYAVKGADNKACDNTQNDCTQYTLTAELSTGQPYSRTNLN